MLYVNQTWHCPCDQPPTFTTVSSSSPTPSRTHTRLIRHFFPFIKNLGIAHARCQSESSPFIKMHFSHPESQFPPIQKKRHLRSSVPFLSSTLPFIKLTSLPLGGCNIIPTALNRSRLYTRASAEDPLACYSPPSYYTLNIWTVFSPRAWSLPTPLDYTNTQTSCATERWE